MAEGKGSSQEGYHYDRKKVHKEKLSAMQGQGSKGASRKKKKELAAYDACVKRGKNTPDNRAACRKRHISGGRETSVARDLDNQADWPKVKHPKRK